MMIFMMYKNYLNAEYQILKHYEDNYLEKNIFFPYTDLDIIICEKTVYVIV